MKQFQYNFVIQNEFLDDEIIKLLFRPMHYQEET